MYIECVVHNVKKPECVCSSTVSLNQCLWFLVLFFSLSKFLEATFYSLSHLEFLENGKMMSLLGEWTLQNVSLQCFLQNETASIFKNLLCQIEVECLVMSIFMFVFKIIV